MRLREFNLTTVTAAGLLGGGLYGGLLGRVVAMRRNARKDYNARQVAT